MALESRLNRIWRTRRPSARKRADAVGSDNAQFDRRFRQAILYPFGRRLHRFDHIDFFKAQLQRACIDRREIENVVDDGEQSGRGFRHIAGIFELLGVERADDALGQQLRKADDVGERRAQFIADVMNEVVAQFLRPDERLIALLERALDIDAGGDVEERQQRRPVRQRYRRAVENEAILALDASLINGAVLGQSDDDGAQRGPEGGNRQTAARRISPSRRYAVCRPRESDRSARARRKPD